MSDLSVIQSQTGKDERVVAVVYPDQLVFISQNIVQLIKDLILAALLTSPVWLVKLMSEMLGEPQTIFVHPILIYLADAIGLGERNVGDYVFVGFFAFIFIFAISVSITRFVRYFFLSKSIRYALTDKRIMCLGSKEKTIWSFDLEEVKEVEAGRKLADWLFGRQTHTVTLRLGPSRRTGWERYPSFIWGVRETDSFSRLIIDAKNA